MQYLTEIKYFAFRRIVTLQCHRGARNNAILDQGGKDPDRESARTEPGKKEPREAREVRKVSAAGDTIVRHCSRSRVRAGNETTRRSGIRPIVLPPSGPPD